MINLKTAKALGLMIPPAVLARADQARGFSQEELAKSAGISRGCLARLQTARQDPTLSTLEKLAKPLGVPVGRLLE